MITEKREARTAAAARRAEAHRVLGPRPPGAAAALLRALEGAEGPVAGYWPIRTEIDPRPVMEALSEQGVELCLPEVVARAAPLRFRRWRPGAALAPAGFGLSVPRDAPEVTPRVLIVPLLAFDAERFRLGYGGGHYDRTLALLRAGGPLRAVGFAYAAQQVAAVPREATDARLDVITTEAGSV